MDMLAEPAPLAGRKPAVPDGTRLYVVGDVHGRLDLLEEIERRIEADLQANPSPHVVQVMLGDYVDRGPQSREVIDHLIALPRRREAVTLRGNHEVYIIEMEPRTFPQWCLYGGRRTLASYGLDLTGYDDAALEAATAELIPRAQAVIPAAHMAFLNATRLTWRCGDYLFVHAGLRPGVPIAAQDPQDLVWIRKDFLENDEDHGVVVVHGHTPTPEPVIRHNRIGIDTRAYESGILTCLVLEGAGQRFITTA